MERTGSVEQLIRMVVGRKPQNHSACGPDYEESAVEEVLLDVEVDGTRYLLIRLPKPIQRDVQLSPREQEIVRLVALGHSNKMIAGVLNISSWTVCTHLRRIFSKLGVGSRAAVVARVPEMGNVRVVARNREPSGSFEPSEAMTGVSSRRFS
jgi:DNA-binding CsgD family transcriptional regulator